MNDDRCGTRVVINIRGQHFTDHLAGVCDLLAGHPGQHQATVGGQTIRWDAVAHFGLANE